MREKKRYEGMSVLCAPPPSVVSAFPERKRERKECVCVCVCDHTCIFL